MPRLATSCLINNYNYGEFVGDAIEGALRQTAPFDEIIVVDDGSTDGSLELIKAKYGRLPSVQIIGKTNAGQLSCFNEGFARATGDVIFFLDSDDIYEPEYAERALEVYQRDSLCDFLACGRRLFGRVNETRLIFPDDRDLGYAKILTHFRSAWIGGPTSTLSIRRRILDGLLPLPFIEDWRIRADECLVFGSSLAGARKRYLAKPLVRYRTHDRNHFFASKRDDNAAYHRAMAVNRLFEFLERKHCYNGDRLAKFAHKEFRTIERPTMFQLFQYSQICLTAQMSLVQKVSSIVAMCAHLYRGKKPGKAPAPGLDELPSEQRRLAA
jgi:glycosyltransferase involved in cell wall biosynthesis